MVSRGVDGVLDDLVTVWRWCCCGVCKNMWHNESRHVSRQRPESRLGTGSTTCLIHSIDWLSKSKNHLRAKIPPVQSSRDKWRSMWSVLFPISGNRFCASAFLTSLMVDISCKFVALESSFALVWGLLHVLVTEKFAFRALVLFVKKLWCLVCLLFLEKLWWFLLVVNHDICSQNDLWSSFL